MTASTDPLATASVDDSDGDEPFSPERKTTNEQTLDGSFSPPKMYSINYADEFGIDPASPTRQFLRAGHSTTMEKLQKKTLSRSQSTTLESVTSRRPLRKEDFKPSSANGIETERNTLEGSGISFLSRDGDALARSSISMSTPDFAMPQNVSPIRDLSFPNGSMAPTELLSEEEVPLHVLIQGQIPDGLPSTKQSSGGATMNPSTTQPSIGGTQDDIAAAAQIGDDLLANMLNDHVDANGMLQAPQQADDDQDELAQPMPGTTKSRGSASHIKPSRKRARTVPKEDIRSSEANKKHRLDDNTEDDIFAGMPVEHYQPRGSRSRTTALKNIFNSEVEVASSLAIQTEEGKGGSSRRQPVGNIITPISKVVTILEDDEDEKSDSEAQQAPISVKPRLKDKKRREMTEESAPALDTESLSQIHDQSQDSKDIIVVGDKQSQNNADASHSQEKTSKKAKKRGRKGIQKQELDEENHSQPNDQTIDDVHLNVSQLSLQHDTEVAADTNIQGDDDEEEKEPVPKALQSLSVQPVSNDTATAPTNNTEEKMEQPTETKKPKGRTKGRGRPKKSAVEVITLAASTDVSPVKAMADEEISVDTKPVTDDLTSTELEHPLHTNEEPSAQVLSDKTNTTAVEKPMTPEKPSSTSKHSPIRRVPHRVGLSRRSRIEPLLKIVRKEKDLPKDPGSKKKKS